MPTGIQKMREAACWHLQIVLTFCKPEFITLKNGSGLAEVVEIRETQPTPCTKDELKN
jgi:hypothetical protein